MSDFSWVGWQSCWLLLFSLSWFTAGHKPSLFASIGTYLEQPGSTLYDPDFRRLPVSVSIQWIFLSRGLHNSILAELWFPLHLGFLFFFVFPHLVSCNALISSDLSLQIVPLFVCLLESLHCRSRQAVLIGFRFKQEYLSWTRILDCQKQPTPIFVFFFVNVETFTLDSIWHCLGIRTVYTYLHVSQKCIK